MENINQPFEHPEKSHATKISKEGHYSLSSWCPTTPSLVNI